MTDHRSSRRHGDGHGGSTKHSAEFAARSEYGDVFGGVAGSCSIPFLDLPPQPDVCDEMGPGDYAEIFGGFGGIDFAVDYEELFGKKKKKNNSNGRRILKETEVGRQANDTSDVHGEGAWGGRNHFPPNSEHSDDGSRQFSMSFHKTNHRSIEDIVSGTTDVTHLHAVTGYTDMIDSFSPLHGTETDNPPKVVKNDHIHIASSHRGLPDENQVNITFRGDCEKSFGAELKTQQKQFTNRYPTGEDAPANVRYHSRSSSNHSSSSGDVSHPDVAFVTISDINLRTEPSRVPPPSRAPPKLVGKQGQPKMNIYGSFKADLEEGSLPKTMGNRQTHYSLGVSKSHLINKGVKDGSPCFFDVEVDASSAAAASAAAMKEAMEQAQARLKSAKELMERKRENVQSRKKMGQQEVMKCDERPEDKTVEKVKCFSEVKTQKTLVEEEGSTKQFSFKEGENVIGTAKEGTTDVKERYFVSSGEDQEIMQGNGFKTTPSVPYKLETPGVWKMDKEFYELVKSENNSKMVKEVHKQEGFEKNQKIATKVNEYNENDVKQAELSCEFGRNGRLHKVEETGDRRADDNFIYGNMAVYEKIREIPNTILKACTGIENVNKFQEVHDSLQRRGNGKELPVQDAHVSEHEPERSNAIKGCAAGDYASRENKKSAEPCSTSFEFDRDTRGEEKERKLEVAEEPCGCDNNEKELVGASVSGVTLETMKRQNKVGGAGMQAQSHMFEILEQLEAVDEAYQCESHQKTRRDNKSAYCHEESGYKFEDTTSALEEEIQGLNRSEKSGFCLQQSQVVEGTNQCEADLVKLEAVQGTFEQRECEETTNLTEEVGLQGSEEITAREVKEEIHQDEKQQKAAQALWEKGNCEEARISEGLKERVTEKIGGGVHMSSDFEEMHEVSVAGQDECQRAADKESENIQQASLLEEKANIQNSVPDDIELCPVNLRSSAQDNIQQASLMEEKANIQNSVPDDIELCPVNLRSSAQDNIDTRQINSQSPAQVGTENHHTVLTENAMPDMHKPDEREHVRRNENEQEKEQARNLDEEKEREREREKDRLAVERATREAHERALTEARERAERIAVERITAEARQRAMAEAREKSEKASAEALEKSLAEKASKEAKLKAERAAVERATAEARERAVEKALAEKAASDARQREEKFNATSRDSRGNDWEDSEINPKPSFANVPRDARFRSASSSSSLKNTDFHFQGDGDSPLRCKARLERHQRTVERAAKALAEKNVRDILAQREQAERNRLAESLDADVRRWSTGKEGNLRALLSTLQYILGADSGWQPIPLTDVITAVGVKKAYRKATLCVHPDKLQQRGASIRQKYICEKVFDLLKEAWNRFNSEER